MCTAISFKTKDRYFGRNLDLERTYDERVTVAPRGYAFPFRFVNAPAKPYAMIGMATVAEGVPLYYEATNERRLSMAALNFPGYARYFPPREGRDNIPPFELIPWILGSCGSTAQAEELLARVNITDVNFSDSLPSTPLHWMISDGERDITVESTARGLTVTENPVGVLTNAPQFEYHLTRLSDYMMLTSEPPENKFARALHLPAYSRGMGAMGLPGDFSSSSRFIRAAFVKGHSVCECDEWGSVSQFFHILGAVSHPRGCVHLGADRNQITVYSSCCNADKGLYYYTTYDDPTPRCVNMHACDLSEREPITFPVLRGGKVIYQN